MFYYGGQIKTVVELFHTPEIVQKWTTLDKHDGKHFHGWKEMCVIYTVPGTEASSGGDRSSWLMHLSWDTFIRHLPVNGGLFLQLFKQTTSVMERQADVLSKNYSWPYAVETVWEKNHISATVFIGIIIWLWSSTLAGKANTNNSHRWLQNLPTNREPLGMVNMTIHGPYFYGEHSLRYLELFRTFPSNTLTTVQNSLTILLAVVVIFQSCQKMVYARTVVTNTGAIIISKHTQHVWNGIFPFVSKCMYVIQKSLLLWVGTKRYKYFLASLLDSVIP